MSTAGETPSNDVWRQKVNRWAIGIVVGLVVVIGFAGCVAGSINSDKQHPEEESIAQCEARIGRLLKAPSTADYASTTEGAGADTWKVTGTVDAENSFGAKVRAEYGCTVVMNDNSTATTTVDYFNQ